MRRSRTMASSILQSDLHDPIVFAFCRRQFRGLVTGTSTGFMFATGIECSAPTIGNGTIRRDLLEECGHYARWQEDLALTHGMGLRYLRYGLPYHRIHLASGSIRLGIRRPGDGRNAQARYRSDTGSVCISASLTGWATFRTPNSRCTSLITPQPWHGAIPGCATSRR